MLKRIIDQLFFAIMFRKIFSHLLALIIFKVIYSVINEGEIAVIFIENQLKTPRYKM